jgi:hypothetical protein
MVCLDFSANQKISNRRSTWENQGSVVKRTYSGPRWAALLAVPLPYIGLKYVEGWCASLIRGP